MDSQSTEFLNWICYQVTLKTYFLHRPSYQTLAIVFQKSKINLGERSIFYMHGWIDGHTHAAYKLNI